MQKQRITKQQIFDAAKLIAHLGKEPTTASVRKHLAFTGSQTTLYKYLKEWKLKCFKAYKASDANNIEHQDLANLQAENQTLMATIGKMEEHSKIVAAEFTKTERKNVALTQKVTYLGNQAQLLETELRELKKDKAHLEHLYRELKAEREVLLGRMERDKDQLIAALREELHQTHQANLKQIQDVSYHGHELLIQEKVKSLNLEEKVKASAAEITSLQQALDSARQGVAPLKAHIKQLEKLIAENLTSEQLQAYDKKFREQEFASK